MERTYTVPLRKEYQKVPRWKRTKKAITALKQFLGKHMKSDNVKLGTELNEKMWKHGIKNPPHHVKVSVTKDKDGVVKAELFGAKTAKAERKAAKKEVKATKKETKEPVKREETPVKKEKMEEVKPAAETPKVEEKAEVKEKAPVEEKTE
ncbi:MAG: 60S ribosomal protein L31 [Nanoarchaeota archaeon]|nr:60S ribosomal protein L31 [Nanoarchaeota archaeon]